MTSLPRLVAHRGDMQQYPENTLPALKAAIDAGACFVEFDIQFSQDVVPMVFHDPGLARTTGVAGRIMELDSSELKTLRADKLPHLKQAFNEACIPTLADTIDLLNLTPQVTAFVELKRHSIEHYETELCVDLIHETMRMARFPWVFISFEMDAIRYARQHYGLPIAWILRKHSAASENTARQLAPDYIFCNVTRLSGKQPYWQGPWQWVVYDIKDAQQAVELHQQGAHMIETGCILEMIDTPPFSPQDC